MSDQQEQELGQRVVVLVVPKQHVKTVKSALEQHSQLDRTSKISPETQEEIVSESNPMRKALRQGQAVQDADVPDRLQGSIAASTSEALPGDQEATPQFPKLKFDVGSGRYVDPEATIRFPILKFDMVRGQYVDPSLLEKVSQHSAGAKAQRMRIQTTIPYALSGDEVDGAARDQYDHELKSKILEDLVLSHLSQDISVSYHVLRSSETTPTASKNLLHKALHQALDAFSEGTLASLDLTAEVLVSSFPDSYSVYKPMLLLPHNAFASKPWTKLLSTHPIESVLLRPVWQRIAEAVGATHVALNSPIPLQTGPHGAESTDGAAEPNILRTPVNLTPIHGDFGPSPTPQTSSSPTERDFASALWVTTTQNGIHQTWAPRYTMFSRGNVGEKTRILTLPSVTGDFDVPSAAIDLYAGIGYFAFSYKKGGSGRKHGIERVLCWELNPWSVEGLRRGAEMNGWTCRLFREENIPTWGAEWILWRRLAEEERRLGRMGDDFWVFQMSNEYALSVIRNLNDPAGLIVPPVRHINLGLLPTSQLSWRTAVRVLDIKRGGWIHAHENVGINDINTRNGEVQKEFQRLLDEFDAENEGDKDTNKSTGRVMVEHVEKVKMYAPGVAHVVFDVLIERIGE